MTQADLAGELRGARPVAPDAVRNRVRTIVAAGPPPRPTVGARLGALRPTRRRTFLALVPVAAAGAALAAGVVGLVRPDPPASTVAIAARDIPATTGTAEAPALDKAIAGSQSSGGRSAPAPPVASKMAAPATERAPLPATGDDRAQRTSVALALELPDLDGLSGATQKAISLTRSLGGFVVSVSYGASQAGSASLVLKVPSSTVQEAVARLSSLGKITSQNIQIEDLQASLDEIARQSNVLRNRIATITRKLEDTSLSTEARAQLEATRRTLRDELLGGQQSARATKGEAAFATIQLDLRTAAEEVVVPPAPSRLDHAGHEARRILELEGIVLLYTAVVALPLALLTAGIVLLARTAGRRQRERLLG